MAERWLRLVEHPELAARLPALVSSSVNDRATGWKRGQLERDLHDVWMLVTDDDLDGFANFAGETPPPFVRPAELTHVWIRAAARRQGRLRAGWEL
jgi:hypothetical protein